MSPNTVDKSTHWVRQRLRWACLACAMGLCVAATSCFWLSDAAFVVGHDALLRMPLLSHWGNLRTVFSPFFTSFTDGQYRPLSYAVLAVGRTFVPLDSPRLWQVWLLGFQALNGLMVYGLARSLSGSVWAAVTAAAIFALHPLSSVMTTHVAHFHYLLGLSLFLGALLAYLRMARTGRGRWAVVSVLLFACGLLTNKAVAALPAIVLAAEFALRTPWRKVLARLSPFVVCLLLVTSLWLTQLPPVMVYKYPAVPSGTWLKSLISVVAGSGHYLYGLLVGANVPVVLEEVIKRRDRMGTLAFVWPTALYLLVAGGAAWLLWQARRARARGDAAKLRAGGLVGLAVVWGFATFAPFLSTGWNAVEDYVAWPYMYFPLVGIALLGAALAAAAAQARETAPRVAAGCIVAAWCGCFAVQLVQLNVAAASAGSYWRHVLRIDPKSARASVALGTYHLGQGCVQQALPLLFNESVAHPGASSLAMARHYLSKGEVLAAAIHCRAALSPASGLQNQAAKPLTAELLRQAGALDSAEALWGEVLLANPFNTAAMVGLAEVWRLKGFVAAARAIVAHAIEIDPSDSALYQMRRRLQAWPETPPVVALRPREELAYLLVDADSPAIHRRIVALSERLDTDPVVLLSASVSLTKHGEYRRALGKLSGAERLLPSSGLLWATRCYAYVQLGADPEATAAADEAIRLGESDANTCCMVGTALLKQGRAKRAIGCLRRAVQISPSYASGHTNLGLALLITGRLPEATAHLRQAVKLRPVSAQAHTDLATALLAQGQVQQAVACLNTALQLDPNFAEAHVQMASVLLQQGRGADAQKHLHAAESLSPSSTRRLPKMPGAALPQGPRTWRAKPGA